jgi:hypothetical protein
MFFRESGRANLLCDHAPEEKILVLNFALLLLL